MSITSLQVVSQKMKLNPISSLIKVREYLMNISIGTPPFEILAITDTGSDLTWTQCEPCPECYKQDAPLFNPKSSSTYKRLEFTCSSFGTTEGNIIIDSGTTLTVLPQEFYLKLETLLVSEIDSKRVDAPAETLSLWYEAQNDFKVPNITVRFTNADVKLSPLNTFVLVSEGVSCFSFTTISDFSIYGNLAQMNFLVGYDIENQALSFKPTACTKE
ncbi:hypothetical protein QUC31_010052 [Theobroma cacao]